MSESRVVLSPARPGLTEAPPSSRQEEMEEVDERGGQPDGARIFEGINIGGHTVTACTEHLPEGQRNHVRWLYHHAREQGWSWEELARKVGYSSTTWSRIFRDKYRVAKGDARAGERMDITDQVAAIDRYRRTWDERQETSASQTGFIETSIWVNCEWLMRRAFVRQKIGLIWGESQIGKSASAVEYSRRYNHGETTLVEMPPASGVQLMLRTIAEGLKVPSHAGFDKLLANVCQALDGSRLLIVDEIHRVFTTYQKTSVMRCLDTLRFIHERTRCGLVLIGTNVMRDQLQKGEFSHYLNQFRRRARTLMLQLPSEPPRDDLDKMAMAFGLDPAEGDAERKMLAVARSDGFGAVKMLLQDATERAAKKRRKVTWDDFLWALSLTERMAGKEGA